MKLPVLVAIPHGGTQVPAEVEPYIVITEEDIIADGDEGARIIYDIAQDVRAVVSTDIARAFIDMNRAEDDLSRDGIVKTHTCWDKSIYNPYPPQATIKDLIRNYYLPYHRSLTGHVTDEVILGLDCHTMAATGPPVGPDPGKPRPAICLSNGEGTCPQTWLRLLANSIEKTFEVEVSIGSPFRGGYTIRAHAAELPWIQVEISRAPFISQYEKRRRFLHALKKWYQEIER